MMTLFLVTRKDWDGEISVALPRELSILYTVRLLVHLSLLRQLTTLATEERCHVMTDLQGKITAVKFGL